MQILHFLRVCFFINYYFRAALAWADALAAFAATWAQLQRTVGKCSNWSRAMGMAWSAKRGKSATVASDNSIKMISQGATLFAAPAAKRLRARLQSGRVASGSTMGRIKAARQRLHEMANLGLTGCSINPTGMMRARWRSML